MNDSSPNGAVLQSIRETAQMLRDAQIPAATDHLHEGLASLNGLTDGWAMLLDQLERARQVDAVRARPALATRLDNDIEVVAAMLMRSTAASPLRAVLNVGATYFALVFGAGFLLGMVRVPLLAPRLGERMAELLEMPVMFAVIVAAARWLVVRFRLAYRPRRALAAGVIALAMLIAAELTLALLVQSQTLSAYIASRDPVSGSVYLGMLLAFAGMPFVVARRRV